MGVGDPLGGCSVTPGCYAQMTRMLQSVCPKIVLVLEGGYNIDATADCAVACTRALLGDAVPYCTLTTPKKEARAAFGMTLHVHRPFWPSLPPLSAIQMKDFPVPLLTKRWSPSWQCADAKAIDNGKQSKQNKSKRK